MSAYNYQTDFLFSTSNLLSGAASTLNLAGNFYSFNHSTSDVEADAKALRADWGVVAQDIHASLTAFEVKNGQVG